MENYSKISFYSLIILVFFFTPLGAQKNKIKTEQLSDVYVSFTLENKSSNSIPLIIPGVMKPNLSPNSMSGVNLNVGQKIYFRYKGKRRLLFEVRTDFSMKTIDVAAELDIRKKMIEGS